MRWFLEQVLLDTRDLTKEFLKFSRRSFLAVVEVLKNDEIRLLLVTLILFFLVVTA